MIKKKIKKMIKEIIKEIIKEELEGIILCLLQRTITQDTKNNLVNLVVNVFNINIKYLEKKTILTST